MLLEDILKIIHGKQHHIFEWGRDFFLFLSQVRGDPYDLKHQIHYETEATRESPGRDIVHYW